MSVPKISKKHCIDIFRSADIIKRAAFSILISLILRENEIGIIGI
jgi:hypothetical protein